MTASTTSRPGRRPATDHAAIERAAFVLFSRQGFDETSMEQIADAVGVGRRTLFRYFPSKNDIPWGQFDDSLDRLRAELAASDPDLPLFEQIQAGVVAFNRVPDEAVEQHRQRMRLLFGTPALQAHSALRYGAWRMAIAEHVARRTGQRPTDPLPRLVGHVSLAMALSAYGRWLEDPRASLPELLGESLTMLRDYLA